MRWVVVGAGAVGGVIGGRLIGAGEEVTLIARGSHADAIERAGLTVESPGGSRVYRPAALRRPGETELEPGDIVLLAVKSQDTADALAALRGEHGESVALASAQNGVTNEDVAARRFVAVYGVMVWMPAVHLEPGVVSSFAERDALLRIGCWPEGDDPRAHQMAAALSRAGLDAEAVPDIARWKRGKLLSNLVNTLDAFFVAGGRRELYLKLVAEGEAAMNAAGAAFMPPDELISYGSARLPVVPIGSQKRPGGSTWQSLSRGIPSSEVAHLNGYVVELGKAHGVPTPFNSAIVELAAQFERGERPPRSMTADELRSLAKASS